MLQSWILPLYPVAYGAGLKTVDFIVEGLDRSKSVMIITDKADEVCTILSELLGSGMTVIDAKGYYSDTNKKVIYIVVNCFQITRMKDAVHSEDPSAYITISEVADVFKQK